MSNFQKDLAQLINKYCIENESDTPDFMIAEYLDGCLQVYNETITKREEWYGRSKQSQPLPTPV